MKLIINTDGGARGNPGPAGIGVVVADESGAMLGLHKKYIGKATNNSAEYQALILALTEVAKLDAADIIVNMDSQLVVRQMQGKYKIKDPGLKILAAEALKLIKNFRQVHFKYVPREQNRQADLLVNEAIDEAVESSLNLKP